MLRSARRIAVVGLGTSPIRPAYGVARYLVEAGYDVVPVHPAAKPVFGRTAYPDLGSAAAAGPVDVVNLFRRSDAIPGHVDELLAVRPTLAWMQVGIAHEASARRLEAAGIAVVMDLCLMIEHHRLGV